VYYRTEASKKENKSGRFIGGRTELLRRQEGGARKERYRRKDTERQGNAINSPNIQVDKKPSQGSGRLIVEDRKRGRGMVKGLKGGQIPSKNTGKALPEKVDGRVVGARSKWKKSARMGQCGALKIRPIPE